MTTIRAFIRRRRRLIAAGVLAAAFAAIVWLRIGPLPPGLLDLAEPSSTLVLDRHGEQLFEARSTLGLRGDVLAAGALPASIVDATLAAEDVRFMHHPGVDPIAVVRALWHDLRAGHRAEGGSTITQQVVKLLSARQHGGRVERGWRAKIAEAIFAIRLEHRLTKREILVLYLDLAPYGNQIAGIQRASHAYFGIDAAMTTPAQAAFLAALPQQPSRYNPWRDPSRVRGRQLRILETMAARGWLAPHDAAAARTERLALARDTTPLVAPHFVAKVLAAATAEAAGGTSTPKSPAAAAAPAPPRRIDTTLDARLQRTVQGIIAAERASLDAHHASNVAVAVLDNRTGEWLAWEGSGNYGDATAGGAIDGVTAPRQPGSALKPFTYAAAFERGIWPGHVLADVPSQFPTAETGVLYSPRNYDGRFRGPMLARAALAGSENVPAVALAFEIGVPSVARLLRRAGFTTLDRSTAYYGLGLTLGNAEVRLDEMVAAYAAFARGGEYIAPRSITAIDGRAVSMSPAERVVSPQTAFWITDILSDADARAYIFGRGGQLEFPFPVAAKTGTSQSYFDNWVVGYTRDVTVGVWVGNFDRTPLRGSSGITGAGPIFHAVMLAAVESVTGHVPIDDGQPIVAAPPAVHRVEVCAVSGLAAGPACPTRVSEWAPADLALDPCTWHHLSDGRTITVWPESYRRWARDAGLGSSATPDVDVDAAPASGTATVAAPPRGSHGRPAVPASTDLAILRPLAGAVFLFDPTLRPEFQALSLEARGAAAGTLEWFVDGVPVAARERDGRARWRMSPGRHALLVRDALGRSARAEIVVR